MLVFFKRRKIAKAVGYTLRQTVDGALTSERRIAEGRISSAITSSYICTYISKTFEKHGYDGEKYLEKYLRRICDGVIANKLYDTISANFTEYALCKSGLSGGEERLDELKKLTDVGRQLAESDVALDNSLKHREETHTNNLALYLCGRLDEDDLSADTSSPKIQPN